MNYKETRKITVKGPLAIVNTGGGAAGSDQAGGLAALAQIGIIEQTSLISATSVGGINAVLSAIYAADHKALTRLWEQVNKNRDIYKGDVNGPAAVFSLLFGGESIVDPAPLYKLINDAFGNLTLEDVYKKNKIHLILTGHDLNTGRGELYTTFDETKTFKAADVVKRTSAIPGLFKVIESKDPGDVFPHAHCDGGIFANNPLLTIIKYNETTPEPIKKVIIMFCRPDLDRMPINKASYKKWGPAVLRAAEGALINQELTAELFIESQTQTGALDVLAIYPEENPCDILDFTKTKANLQNGYNRVVAGLGYSYKDRAIINIADFLRR